MRVIRRIFEEDPHVITSDRDEADALASSLLADSGRGSPQLPHQERSGSSPERPQRSEGWRENCCADDGPDACATRGGSERRQVVHSRGAGLRTRAQGWHRG